MAAFDQSEYEKRIRKLQDILKEKNAVLAVFNQSPDLLYYTGSIQPLYLFLPAGKKAVVAARKAIQRIREEIQFIRLEVFNNSKDFLKIMEPFSVKPKDKIGFTFDTTSYATVSRIMQFFPGAEAVDISWETRLQRTIKSPAEMKYVRQAGQTIKNIPELVKSQFRPGMSELELSLVIEDFFRLNGDGGIHNRQEAVRLESGLCSSGKNSLAGTKFDGICGGQGISPASPYGASRDKIEKNVPVMIDYAFTFERYHIDQTRMFSWGKPPKEALNAYEAMLKVEEAVIKELKPGNTWTSIYEMACKKAEELGYSETFMGFGQEKVKFIGHGVGLELDEPPFLAPKMNYPLETGMTIAIEPKAALPDFGIIGIEDTIFIGEHGVEILTDCPNEWIIN